MSLTIRQDLTEQVHANSVLGVDSSVPRAMAINLVPTSNLSNPAELLRRVLENGNEDPKYRRLSAMALWRLNTTEAREALLNAAQTLRDPAVLTAVIKCLGRIGDERALEAIETIQSLGEGALAKQASFAAALIAHRLGLTGHDLSLPLQFESMPPTDQRRIDFMAPPREDIEQFVACLEAEPFAIELDLSSLRLVQCPGGSWILGFSQSFVAAGSLAVLQKRKSVCGVLARKNPEDGRYSVACLVLTAPGKGEQVDILIHRSTGALAWAGVITPANAREARFFVRTAGRIGIVPIELEGAWLGGGQLEVTSAVSGTQVIEKQKPLPLDLTAWKPLPLDLSA